MIDVVGLVENEDAVVMIVEEFTFVKLEVVVTGLVDVVVIEVAVAGEAAVVVENITIFFFHAMKYFSVSIEVNIFTCYCKLLICRGPYASSVRRDV